MTDECWHLEEYGSHCWQPIPNALPHETAERCDVCGETRGQGAIVTPPSGRNDRSLDTGTEQ